MRTLQLVFWTAALLPGQTLHHLAATPQTVVVGNYAASNKPVLRIHSGDSVKVECVSVGKPERLEAAGARHADIKQALRDIEEQVTERGPGGHPLTGPIFIEGAEPGDVLEVRILKIEMTEPYAFNSFGPKSGFLHAPGALFQVGDGHAGQGNGEVDITAMETSLTGTFRFIVRKDLHLTWPRAETPKHYITMGLNADLTEAAKGAAREMIDFLVAQKHLSRDDAYMLTSVAADLSITQAVDGNLGVHASIAKALFVGR